VAFHVETTRNNGYRCSCCRRTWTDDAWFEDRAEALAEVPKTCPVGEYELEKIEVRDGASGEVIASAKLTWAGGRSERYQYQRWAGFIDGVLFEEIKGGQPGESWSDTTARVRREAVEAKLKVAEAEAAQLRDELTRVR